MIDLTVGEGMLWYVVVKRDLDGDTAEFESRAPTKELAAERVLAEVRANPGLYFVSLPAPEYDLDHSTEIEPLEADEHGNEPGDPAYGSGMDASQFAGHIEAS
jgi:hypothetical protein